ncbi:hypothetical protein EJB05_39088, partial [Eragrostis curvula]
LTEAESDSDGKIEAKRPPSGRNTTIVGLRPSLDPANNDMAEFSGHEAVEKVAEMEAQTVEGDDQEDRLSNLPDDILMCILDRVDVLRDVVRTGVLSRRWRHVVGLLSEITLNPAYFEPPEDGSIFTLDALVQSNVNLVKAVTSVLAHKSQRTIKHLSLSFYLRDESIDIVRSVDHTMANRDVVTASFKIIPEKTDLMCTNDDVVIYGRRFLSFFHNYPRVFAGLKSLHIESLRLGNADIADLLGTSKKLEYLRLHNCDCGVQSVLQIEHPQLTELDIVFCAFEKVELNWLPNLQRLTCSTVHKTFELSELLDNTIIVQLDLNFQSERIWIQPEAPRLLRPLLQNLRIVSLRGIHGECDLDWTMFFLEAAPLLKKISIWVWDHTCDGYEEDEFKEYDQLWQQILQKEEHGTLKWETPEDFKHYNLRALVIRCFEAEERFTKYIRRVIKAAVNLERISLFDSGSCARCHFSFPRTVRHLMTKQISEWRSSPLK